MLNPRLLRRIDVKSRALPKIIFIIIRHAIATSPHRSLSPSFARLEQLSAERETLTFELTSARQQLQQQQSSGAELQRQLAALRRQLQLTAPQLTDNLHMLTVSGAPRSPGAHLARLGARGSRDKVCRIYVDRA